LHGAYKSLVLADDWVHLGRELTGTQNFVIGWRLCKICHLLCTRGFMVGVYGVVLVALPPKNLWNVTFGSVDFGVFCMLMTECIWEREFPGFQNFVIGWWLCKICYLLYTSSVGGMEGTNPFPKSLHGFAADHWCHGFSLVLRIYWNAATENV